MIKSDATEKRKRKILSQRESYDKKGERIRKWNNIDEIKRDATEKRNRKNTESEGKWE